jgi:hypothetical protein
MEPDFYDLVTRLTLQSASESDQRIYFAKELFRNIPSTGEAYTDILRVLDSYLLDIDKSQFFEFEILIETFDKKFRPLVSKCQLFAPEANIIQLALADGTPTYFVGVGTVADSFRTRQIQIQYATNRLYFKIQTKNVFTGFMREAHELLRMITDDRRDRYETKVS